MARMHAALALLIATIGLPAVASQQAQHASHHPAAAIAPQPADPGATAMDEQLKAMAAMHERMMAARTPAERKALMAEHEKLMRNGMQMMGDMSHESSAMDCNMAEKHRDMAAQMRMMQAMMQMMMDRMPGNSE